MFQIVIGCTKKNEIVMYTGDFLFSIQYKRYDYLLLRTVEDTMITFEGNIKTYEIGDYSKDIMSAVISDNSADQRLTIEFDRNKIITPIVSSDGGLSMERHAAKESYYGRFSNPDLVSFEIFIEPGHAPVVTYNVTGKRMNK